MNKPNPCNEDVVVLAAKSCLLIDKDRDAPYSNYLQDKVLQFNNTNFSAYYEKNDEYVIEAAVPIIKDQKTIGSVLVAASGNDVDTVVNRVMWAIWLFGIAVVIVVFLLGVFIATLLTKPIINLTAFIKNMPKDKLQKCDLTSKDEVGDLIVAFNELIDRVDELEEKRRT